MADPISTDIALVDVRRNGDRWQGFVTQPWFRYFVASNPDGFGTGTGLLHGNPSGAPTWGPVDLAIDVSGILPVANGGLGGAAGTVHQVLHGGGAGAPSFSAVDAAADVTGVLPVVHGGTGVTTSTGTGSVVLSSNANMSFPTISAPTLQFGTATLSWQQQCPVTYNATASLHTSGHVIGGSSNVTAINNAGFTELCTAPGPLFFFIHDQTSGGSACGMVDPIGGLSTLATTMAGIALTFDVVTFRLKAQVTAGASPRNISAYIVTLG